MGENVLRSDKGGAATLTLNRPDKLNALNVEMFVELDAHVKAIAAATEKVGLVIVRGAGRCFSAGHDLADIATGEKLPEPFYQSKVIERLANLPQPVISAVHGHCYTGALELALAGDIVFAAEGGEYSVLMDFQPGDMQFINNYHVLHGRTAYEDDRAAGKIRHLKRLWLETEVLTERPAQFVNRVGDGYWSRKLTISRMDAQS